MIVAPVVWLTGKEHPMTAVMTAISNIITTLISSGANIFIVSLDIFTDQFLGQKTMDIVLFQKQNPLSTLIILISGLQKRKGLYNGNYIGISKED